MTASTAPRVFDALVRFDDRSRAYPVRSTGRVPRSYTWRCEAFLDQGREGACVGHAFAHDAAARPAVCPVTPALAFGIYRDAQHIDYWPGNNYSGTSVLAGAQTYVTRGYATGYRWAFTLADLILGVGYDGPCVLGVSWHEGMWNTGPGGLITPSGPRVGRHAILLHAIRLVWNPGTTPTDKRLPDWPDRLNLNASYATLHNSWGPSWGVRGGARITLADLQRLRADQGEVCFPVGRSRVEVAA